MELDMTGLETTKLNNAGKKKGKYAANTTRIIALGFLFVVLAGTVLLTLPVSSADGTYTNPLTAAFTSVSATCVTGLATVTTATHWSIFGQVIILIMIQIGGLGFMTVTVLLSLLIRRNVTPRERMLVAMSYNLSSYDSMLPLVKRIMFGTLIFEGSGAVILATQFIPRFGWADGIYKSIFHSVSAFCNAGFDILGETSLSEYAGNYVVNFTLIFLIVVGGIGFIVWNDVVNFIKERRRISVYSKFVLIMTVILLLSGTVLFSVTEWNHALAGMSPDRKILASFFQSATLRTAGFYSIDNAAMGDAAKVISIIFMFIGGASGSTAGGVKVVTVGLLFFTVWRVFIGRKDTVMFKRKISNEHFVRAVSVIVVQIFVIVIGTVLIVIFDPEITLMQAVFETTSATDTVGLSLGITGVLSPFSQVVLMFLMYFGRVGVLTISYSIMVRMGESDPCIRYPDANMLIG